MVPVGTAAGVEVSMTNVTDSPKTEGFFEEAMAILVAVSVTECVIRCELGRKFASPS